MNQKNSLGLNICFGETDKPIDLFKVWFEDAKKEVFIKIDPEYDPCEILN